MKLNKLLVGFVLCASPFLAQAQAYICPSGAGPGERQVGMTPSSNGVASMPLCVSQGGGGQYQGPRFDPSHRIPDWLVLRGAEVLKRERQQRLDSAKNKGSWSVYQEGEPPVPGQKCNAVWVSASGVITLGTTGGFDDPALLIYTGENIPHSQTPVPEDVHVRENGRGLDVQGMRYTFPNSSAGSIIIGLQSLHAAIGVMEDVVRVQVDVDGKEVIDITWRNGNEMTAELAQCGRT